MKSISSADLERLFEEARKSDRKRSHLLLHASHAEKVQRLCIGLLEGSYVEPHYHDLDSQWEMFVVLEGRLQVTVYSIDSKEVLQDFYVGDGELIKFVEFRPMEAHSVRCVSPRALMLEVKEGPFDPAFAKRFLF